MHSGSIFEALSLILTFPVLLTSFLVIRYWSPDTIKAFRSKMSEWEAFEWFIVGVTVGFFGSFFDNLYWGAAWAAKFANCPFSEGLFYWGSVPNVPFRQVAGVFAGYCHLRSAYVYLAKTKNISHKSLDRRLHAQIILAVLVGLIFITVLWIVVSYTGKLQ